MTIRSKVKPTSSEEADLLQPISNEPGFFIECDSCFAQLTSYVRIRCADPVCEASSTDICADCFRTGREFNKHKRNHPYRVIEKHHFPILDEDWTADEEVMLLEGLLMHGMGNWLAVSEYMGSRTKADVEAHYLKYYINSSRWPEPDVPESLPVSNSEEMRAKKRRRIEYLTVNPPLPLAPVQNSGPTSHEIAGYMPGRLEFEHEAENDAEELIKDIEFGIVRAFGGDQQVQDPADVSRRLEAVKQRQEAAKALPKIDPNGTLRNTPIEVKDEDDEGKDELPPIPDAIETHESINTKLALIYAYGDRLDKREHAKALLLDRGLLEARKWQSFNKNKPKEEKDFHMKLRPFAKLQTAQDNEDFVDGLVFEQTLRKRITELQEIRKKGITSFAEVDIYYRAKQARDIEFSQNSDKAPKRSASQAGLDRRSKAPLTLGTAPSLNLLTPDEQSLCSQLRLLPRAYLAIKATIIREYQRRGGELSRKQARDLLKCDVYKTARVYDLLVVMGLLNPPLEAVEMPMVPPVLTPILTNGITNGYNEKHPTSALINGYMPMQLDPPVT